MPGAHACYARTRPQPRTVANFRDFLIFFISLSMGCREEPVIIRFPLIHHNPPSLKKSLDLYSFFQPYKPITSPTGIRRLGMISWIAQALIAHLEPERTRLAGSSDDPKAVAGQGCPSNQQGPCHFMAWAIALNLIWFLTMERPRVGRFRLGGNGSKDWKWALTA